MSEFLSDISKQYNPLLESRQKLEPSNSMMNFYNQNNDESDGSSENEFHKGLINLKKHRPKSEDREELDPI